MTEKLIPLPAVEKISARVIRVLGGNPSKVNILTIRMLHAELGLMVVVHVTRYMSRAMYDVRRAG
jgi:hypothetical protein